MGKVPKLMVILEPPLICNTGETVGDTPDGTEGDRFSLSSFVPITVTDFEVVGSDVILFDSVGFDVTSEMVSVLM